MEYKVTYDINEYGTEWVFVEANSADEAIKIAIDKVKDIITDPYGIDYEAYGCDTVEEYLGRISFADRDDGFVVLFNNSDVVDCFENFRVEVDEETVEDELFDFFTGAACNGDIENVRRFSEALATYDNGIVIDCKNGAQIILTIQVR